MVSQRARLNTISLHPIQPTEIINPTVMLLYSCVTTRYSHFYLSQALRKDAKATSAATNPEELERFLKLQAASEGRRTFVEGLSESEFLYDIGRDQDTEFDPKAHRDRFFTQVSVGGEKEKERGTFTFSPPQSALIDGGSNPRAAILLCQLNKRVNSILPSLSRLLPSLFFPPFFECVGLLWGSFFFLFFSSSSQTLEKNMHRAKRFGPYATMSSAMGDFGDDYR